MAGKHPTAPSGRSNEPRKARSLSSITPPQGAGLRAGDDFKQIKGIGEGIERRLHQAGVLTYADLAAMSPKEVANLLKNVVGMSTKRVAEEEWIAQASNLAIEQGPSKPLKNVSTQEERQHYATFTVKLLITEDNLVRRTHVVHVQDGDQETWGGWDEGRVVSFIAEHAELPWIGTMTVETPTEEPEAIPVVHQLESIPKKEPAGEPTRAEPSSLKPKTPIFPEKPTLKIMDATIHEIGGPAPSNIIGSDQDWSIQVEWELSGVGEDFLKGDWLLIAYLESIGPGADYFLPPDGAKRIRLSDGTATNHHQYLYQEDILIKAGEVKIGIYQLVVSVTWEKDTGQPADLASFLENSLIQIYARS